MQSVEVGAMATPALHVRVPGLEQRTSWALTISLDYAINTNLHTLQANIKKVSSRSDHSQKIRWFSLALDVQVEDDPDPG